MTETQKLYNDLVFKLGQVIKMLNEEEETPENMKIADKINDEVSDITIKLMDGENDFLELKDLDKYSKKLLGNDYFADRRCWSYLRDSLYDIYMNIPNHFNEDMQTGLGMAQELPTNVMYKGGITNLYNKENKKMKRLVNGLTVDDACDIALEINLDVDDDKKYDENITNINKVSDAWEVYEKSWKKFNKEFLKKDFFDVISYLEKNGLFNKKAKEVIDGWMDDIEQIFYYDSAPNEMKLNFGFSGNDIFELKENKEMTRLNEKKIDIETRKEALAEFLDVNVDEINEGYSDDVLEYGNAEYLVLTDDEADEKAHDYTMELLDDIGFESLSKDAQEYCLENFINDSFFETVADEESDYYISEMSDEELLDYAHEHKIAKAIDDVDDENFDRSDLEDQCKYEYRDEILDQGISDYFEGIYGKNWAKEMKDTLEKELDFDAIADYVIESDGRANSLASYDGKENEIKVDGEWFYIYRTN